MRDDRSISPTAFVASKDIVVKKLPKTRSDSQTGNVERRKSISKVRKSSANRSLTKALLNKSDEVPSAESDQNCALTAPNMCDKEMRLCIEDVRNPVRMESTENTMETTRSLPQYVNNGNRTPITKITHAFPKISHLSHHSTEHKSSTRLLARNGESTSPIKTVSSQRKSILAPPVLQPSKLKQNGDTLLLTGNGNLLAAVAAEKITLSNYTSRPSSATSTKTPSVGINQFKQPNGNAAIEVTNFLANPSIIKTK